MQDPNSTKLANNSRFSGLAIWAFVLFSFVPPLGVYLGYKALAAIRSSDGRLRGSVLARIAIIIGWVATAIYTAFFAMIFLAALSPSS